MDANAYLENILLERNLVSEEDCESARTFVTVEKSLIDVLIEKQLINEDILLDLMADYFGITSINLNHYRPDKESLALVPLTLCQKYDVFPLFKIKNTLMLATANPSDVHAMDEIRVKTGFGIEPVFALKGSIRNALLKFYSASDSFDDVLDTLQEEEAVTYQIETKELMEAASDEPTVKLVNLLFTQAIQERASDIHINPEEKILRVRFRIDGVLHEVAQPPKRLQAGIVSRVKILSNLDIAERRLPQDGRIEMMINKKRIDFRVSTLPTIYGENVVVRILDKSTILVKLEELGFQKQDLARFVQLIKKPHGIILTSGPTGSGKTTTLYGALQKINSVDRNIVTLEDPVEYNLELIRQSQVNVKAGYTFGTGLRAILRQDPDVVLVGEIRDLETASIAVQAAMTGHLVLSTLHTNDAVGCVVRLVDMGIQPFLIAPALSAALAQRLVRVICPRCKEKYVPTDIVLKELAMSHPADVTFYHGKGCDDCRNTGYRGRIGLFELMEVTEQVQDAIARNAPESELRKIACAEGMRILREDGFDKIREGITTPEEVARVTKVR